MVAAGDTTRREGPNHGHSTLDAGRRIVVTEESSPDAVATNFDGRGIG